MKESIEQIRNLATDMRDGYRDLMKDPLYCGNYAYNKYVHVVYDHNGVDQIYMCAFSCAYFNQHGLSMQEILDTPYREFVRKVLSEIDDINISREIIDEALEKHGLSSESFDTGWNLVHIRSLVVGLNDSPDHQLEADAIANILMDISDILEVKNESEAKNMPEEPAHQEKITYVGIVMNNTFNKTIDEIDQEIDLLTQDMESAKKIYEHLKELCELEEFQLAPDHIKIDFENQISEYGKMISDRDQLINDLTRRRDAQYLMGQAISFRKLGK